jgi:FAD/FMN-containing dehydrogenase/Fe-S oxidoreductase
MKKSPASPVEVAGEVRALAAALSRRVAGEVRFDSATRALYATDASNYRQVPVGVVIPRTREDVVAAVEVCRLFGAPLFSRGAGTSLAGQCCNVAVALDMSKYLHRVLEVDAPRRLARVEPGTILDDLRAAARPHGLTFGPDPATHDRCTLGGMIGNDSCGVHSVMAAFAGTGARTADNVEELEVLTYDGLRLRVGRTTEDEVEAVIREGGRRGEIYADLKRLRDRFASIIRARYPDIPRRVSGYNLPYLLPERGFHVARALVGSESTCVTVLEATVNLIPEPSSRSLVVLGFQDVCAAADRVPEILEHRPIAVEGLDERLVADMTAVGLHPDEVRLLPAGKGWLFVEFGAASPEEADTKSRRLLSRMLACGAVGGAVFEDERAQQRIWKVREAALGATAHIPNKPLAWPGWEDSAVPPERMGDYMRDLRGLLDRRGYAGDFYGHFGQGCLHARIDFDLETREGVSRYRAFVEEAADLVVSYGGSLSGEHGDGQARGELLPRMFGAELVEAFREFKRIWDPSGRMNPGKVVDARPMTQDLRLAAGAASRPVRPVFAYEEDGGSFSRAVLRCVGVGKCRRTEGGTMCPSFMATREEKHSTRGRARLLFEMLQGEVLRDGWRSEEVKEALDLCLACKGCKGDCPVHVDLATYKAEFLSHYYRGRLRPRSAYAFGLISRWASVASLAPGLANFLTQTPGVRAVPKALAGVAPQRRIPALARRTFRRQFLSRPAGRGSGPDVLLWPDTFHDHFQPGAALAAADVLESAGFRVRIPARSLCCGRPLYDYGMLVLAKRWLARVLETLREDIFEGTPVVVLEPSCAATFRDELPALFPGNEAARRLSGQTYLLAEFLVRRAPDYRPPRLSGKALVQGHCHQKALAAMDDEAKILDATGLDCEILDSGCCGMAGAFGFEAGERYEVSIRCGERVLLPRIREAAAGTRLIADGFSCREQIAQATGRRALHLAELLRRTDAEGKTRS